MTETQRSRVYATNYSVVMDLLGYSQTKLVALKDQFDELIFSDQSVIEKGSELAAATGASEEQIRSCYEKVSDAFRSSNLDDLRIISVKDDEYPALLKGIARPPLVLFCRGNLELLKTPSVSVVGSRDASAEALKRAQRVTGVLCTAGYTVASGLAKGIDTAAHRSALAAGGKTVAVIGTPINKYYPGENRELQEQIAQEQLLVSQFPLAQPVSRYNFPVRNLTMAGISLATVIVEAGDTSGALHQASACISEGRLLFIMKSILEKKELSWPRKYLDKGAMVLDKSEDLVEALSKRMALPAQTKDQQEEQLRLFAKA